MRRCRSNNAVTNLRPAFNIVDQYGHGRLGFELRAFRPAGRIAAAPD
jgi:hypothetical protein